MFFYRGRFCFRLTFETFGCVDRNDSYIMDGKEGGFKKQ